MSSLRPFIPKSQITDFTKVGLEFSIDGTTKQSGTTADMIFDIPSLICFVSGIMRLEVGATEREIFGWWLTGWLV